MAYPWVSFAPPHKGFPMTGVVVSCPGGFGVKQRGSYLYFEGLAGVISSFRR